MFAFVQSVELPVSLLAMILAAGATILLSAKNHVSKWRVGRPRPGAKSILPHVEAQAPESPAVNKIGQAVRVFATDIDGTIVGDASAERRFHDAWEALEPQRRPLLVYNGGLSVAEIRWLVLERRLPEPECVAPVG